MVEKQIAVPSQPPNLQASSLTALDVVVQAILDRQLVPLLGAGISISAKADPSHNLPEGFQNVGSLISVIHKAISDVNRSKQYGHGITPVQTDIDKMKADNRLGELCEQFIDVNSYHHTCPNQHAESYLALCDALKISKFALLEPTSAHRLIAFLACEDLIPEVITTNYDSCLERAFFYAHGLGYDGNQSDAHNRSDFQIHVSHDLDTYRASACTPHLPTFGGTKPVLRVHKINGCAQHFANSSKAERAKRILLTERQLQEWRERAWAADMIRDRLRTRKIMTSGFGSAEPQVRHTVGLVVEEESAVSVSSPDYRGDVLERPNLVIVSDYLDRPERPSFPQHQILIAQWQALFRAGANVSSAIPAPLVHPAYRAFIGPSTSIAFKFAKRAPTLPADDLWLEIYGRVASQLLYNRLHPARSFTQSLSAVVGCGPGLAARLSKTFFPNVSAVPCLSTTGRSNLPIIASPQLFGWQTIAGSQLPLASAIDHALSQRLIPQRGLLRYIPIRSESDTLLWYALVRQALGHPPVPADAPVEELAVVCRYSGQMGDETRVLLRARSREAKVPAHRQREIRNGVVLEIGGMGFVDTLRYASESVPLRREVSRSRGHEDFQYGGVDTDVHGEKPSRPRGTVTPDPVVVDLLYALKTERKEVRTIESFDRLVRHIVTFPTIYRRRAESGLRNLNRRS